MFSHNSASKDDARYLLSRDNIHDDEDHEVVWEQTERNTETPSELWEQDALSSESHELQEASRLESQPSSSQPKVERVKASPKDHGIAGTDLQAEFERIFSPVRHQPKYLWFNYSMNTGKARPRRERPLPQRPRRSLRSILVPSRRNERSTTRARGGH
jgi:hypothetical protein